MDNPIIQGRIVHYCLLWGIRNPDLWEQKNSRLKQVKERAEFRREVRKQLSNYGIQYCCDDQAVFIAENTDGTYEILEGEVLSSTRMIVGDDTLIADRERERVILKQVRDDYEILWQSSENGWMRARNREENSVKPKNNSHLEEFRKANQERIEEYNRVLQEIRARKAMLEPLTILEQESVTHDYR